MGQSLKLQKPHLLSVWIFKYGEVIIKESFREKSWSILSTIFKLEFPWLGTEFS